MPVPERGALVKFLALVKSNIMIAHNHLAAWLHLVERQVVSRPLWLETAIIRSTTQIALNAPVIIPSATSMHRWS
jgi:hypothetical protein